MESKYWLDMAYDLNIYSNIRSMMDEDKNKRESTPTEIEFGGFLWNGNSLVEISKQHYLIQQQK